MASATLTIVDTPEQSELLALAREYIEKCGLGGISPEDMLANPELVDELLIVFRTRQEEERRELELAAERQRREAEEAAELEKKEALSRLLVTMRKERGLEPVSPETVAAVIPALFGRGGDSDEVEVVSEEAVHKDGSTTTNSVLPDFCLKSAERAMATRGWFIACIMPVQAALRQKNLPENHRRILAERKNELQQLIEALNRELKSRFGMDIRDQAVQDYRASRETFNAVRESMTASPAFAKFDEPPELPRAETPEEAAEREQRETETKARLEQRQRLGDEIYRLLVQKADRSRNEAVAMTRTVIKKYSDCASAVEALERRAVNCQLHAVQSGRCHESEICAEAKSYAQAAGLSRKDFIQMVTTALAERAAKAEAQRLATPIVRDGITCPKKDKGGKSSGKKGGKKNGGKK